MSESLLAWIVFTPLIGAAAVLLTGRWPNLREAVSLISGGVLIAQVTKLISPVLAGETPSVLLAVPVMAVIGVLSRFVLGHYLNSPMYRPEVTERKAKDD